MLRLLGFALRFGVLGFGLGFGFKVLEFGLGFAS